MINSIEEIFNEFETQNADLSDRQKVCVIAFALDIMRHAENIKPGVLPAVVKLLDKLSVSAPAVAALPFSVYQECLSPGGETEVQKFAVKLGCTDAQFDGALTQSIPWFLELLTELSVDDLAKAAYVLDLFKHMLAAVVGKTPTPDPAPPPAVQLVSDSLVRTQFKPRAVDLAELADCGILFGLYRSPATGAQIPAARFRPTTSPAYADLEAPPFVFLESGEFAPLTDPDLFEPFAASCRFVPSAALLCGLQILAHSQTFQTYMPPDAVRYLGGLHAGKLGKFLVEPDQLTVVEVALEDLDFSGDVRLAFDGKQATIAANSSLISAATAQVPFSGLDRAMLSLQRAPVTDALFLTASFRQKVEPDSRVTIRDDFPRQCSAAGVFLFPGFQHFYALVVSPRDACGELPL